MMRGVRPTKFSRADFRGWGEQGGKQHLGVVDEPRVAWHAGERVAIARSLKDQRSKFPGTVKGEQDYWKEMTKKFACGRDLQKKDNRKRIKKQLKKVLLTEKEAEKFCEESNVAIPTRVEMVEERGRPAIPGGPRDPEEGARDDLIITLGGPGAEREEEGAAPPNDMDP